MKRVKERGLMPGLQYLRHGPLVLFKLGNDIREREGSSRGEYLPSHWPANAVRPTIASHTQIIYNTSSLIYISRRKGGGGHLDFLGWDITYLWTYDLYGPVHNDFDASRSMTRWEEVGPWKSRLFWALKWQWAKWVPFGLNLLQCSKLFLPHCPPPHISISPWRAASAVKLNSKT